MQIAICLPSRGLIHSRTIEALQATIADCHEWHPTARVSPQWIICHDKPIPDAHNDVAQRGLETNADALLFVEEDNLPPVEALRALVDLLGNGFDLGFVDYPVVSKPDSTCFHYSLPLQKVLWTGMGTTLIRRRVFEGLPYPWFRTDRSYLMQHSNTPHEQITEVARATTFGGQDVHFGWTANTAGFRLGVVSGLRGAQAKLTDWAAAGTNHGVHTVEIWR